MSRARVIPGLLPQNEEETWQGGWFESPFWVTDRAGHPTKAWIGLWLCLGEQGPIVTSFRPERGSDEDVLNLLEEAFERRKTRPGRVEVFDSGLRALLLERLYSSGIEVAVSERRREVDHLLASTASRFGVPDYQSALDVPGITVESMRRFARAARGLFESAPWGYLSDRDLIEIQGGAPPGFQHAVVLGMGRGTFGLGFFEDRDAFWNVLSGKSREASGQWLLSFETIAKLPPGDARLFVDHGLDVACPHAYPLARRFQSQLTVKRPSPKVLEFLSGLLEALASSGPADFDRGRWERTGETSAGPRSYGFVLPYLLAPPSREELAHRGCVPDRRALERFQFLLNRRLSELEPDSVEELDAIFSNEFQGKSIDDMPYEPKNDRERAQEVCFQAFDAWGRHQIVLAERALELNAECVDALVLKGERTHELGEALRFFAQAVAAGEKALETTGAREGMGELWSYYPTRPYLRALHSLGHALEESGKLEEGAACYQRLLALDRHDHQGIRYCRLTCLLGAGLYREAQAHVKAHGEKGESLWSYARALAAFGRHGDGKRAGDALGRAMSRTRSPRPSSSTSTFPKARRPNERKKTPSAAPRSSPTSGRKRAERFAGCPGSSEVAADEPHRVDAFSRASARLLFLRPCRRIPPMGEPGMTRSLRKLWREAGRRRGGWPSFLQDRGALSLRALRQDRSGEPQFEKELCVSGIRALVDEGRGRQTGPIRVPHRGIDTGIQIQMVEAGKRAEGYELEILGGDDDLPLLVIAAAPVSWEELGRMLRKYEGYQVKLEICDLSEEIGDDSLDRLRYLISKAGDRRLN